MQFPYKNKIDKFLVEICRFTGADDRICAFSGAVSHKAVLCVRSRSLLPIGVHLSRPYKALTMPCLTGNSSRSAIINCRLCQQVCHYPTAVRQSVLLPQNGSSRAKCGLLCTRSPQTPTYAFAHLAPKKHY